MTGAQLRGRLRGLGIEVVGHDTMLTATPGIVTWHLRARATTLSPSQIANLSSWLPRGVRLDVETMEYESRPRYSGTQPGIIGTSYGERRVVSVVGESSEPLEPQGLLVDEAPTPQALVVIAPPTPSPGWRGDLFSRISRHFSLVVLNFNGSPLRTLSRLEHIRNIDEVGIHTFDWQWGWATCDRQIWTNEQQSQILARWAVYQELKPLYDVVDGSGTQADIPRDVEAEWMTRVTGGSWTERSSDGRWWLRRGRELMAGNGQSPPAWHEMDTAAYGRELRNFASILDAVAEARVAARSQQPLPASSNTIASPTLRRFDAAALRQAISSDYDIVAVTPLRQHSEPNRGRYLVEVRLLEERGYRCSTTNLPRGVTVRYDISDGGARNVEVPGVREDLVADLDDSPVLRRSREPLDLWPPDLLDGTTLQRQPPPCHVDLDEIKRRLAGVDATMTVTGVRQAKTQAQKTVADHSIIATSSNKPVGAEDRLRRLLPRRVRLRIVDPVTLSSRYHVDGVADEVFSPSPSTTTAATQRWCKQFHTRWNLLDLDDGVRPTILPQQTLKRGKKPVTLAMVQKFRERWGSRDGATAAEVAKVAGFEGNEVALHVLVNHCGGLGDEEALALLGKAGGQPHPGTQEIAIADVDAAAKQHRPAPLLDPDPTADPTSVVTAWRERQRRDREAGAEMVRRVRAAEGQQPSAPAPSSPTRFDLLELDGADDPAVSIAEHKAQRQRRDEAEEAAKRRVAAMKARAQQAAATPKSAAVPSQPRRRLPDIIDASAVPTELQQLIVAGACLVAANEVTAN